MKVHQIRSVINIKELNFTSMMTDRVNVITGTGTTVASNTIVF